MSGSTYGTLFTVTTWGESHGPAIGAVIDGCPAGMPLKASDIQAYLDRRRPGRNRFTTARSENDEAQILSGVFKGRTTGAPIMIMVRNQDQRSRDYGNIKDIYRPGHADYTFDAKYGFRDYRGGGRSSGRETAGRVAAGAVAARLLSCLDVHITTYARSIGPITVPDADYNYDSIFENDLYMPNNEYAAQASNYLEKCISQKDSCGGVIECVVTGLPTGVGEPVFDKLDASLARAVMSIGAVKGVEIGDGFAAASSRGSQNNDPFSSRDGQIAKKSNHSGGTLGGMSDGSPLILRAAVKPTPSIAVEQDTVNTDGENTTALIKGRHDPVIVPRAVVVVESMTAVTVADLMMRNLSSRVSHLIDFYKEL